MFCLSTASLFSGSSKVLQADLEVFLQEGRSPTLEALRIVSNDEEIVLPLDFSPEVLGTDDTGVETWVFRDLVAEVTDPEAADFELLAEGVQSWELKHLAWLDRDSVSPGQLETIEIMEAADGRPSSLLLHFSRAFADYPVPSQFQLVKRGNGDTIPDRSIHLGLAFPDARSVELVPMSGGTLEGRYELVFSGGSKDELGLSFAEDRRAFQVDAPEQSGPGAGLAAATIASTISLPLEESPSGSGLLTAFTSGSFTNTGRDFIKTFEVELESGDQLSAYVNLIESASRYRMRVEDASGTELIGGYWGTYFPIQRLDIPTAGTYRVQFYVDNATTDFDLRIDVGRNLFIEAENNDSQGSSNHLTFAKSSGGFQESAGGALSPLDSNSSWGGSNDVNGDYFDLGTLNAGNTVDVTYQLPANSTLSSGDLELALFADGSVEPQSISTNPVGLSTTITEDGRYFLRVAADDNLDGTSLKFSGQDDRVDLVPESVNGLNVFTIELWARGRPDRRALVSGANGSQDNEILLWFENATEVRYLDRGASYSWTVPRIDELTWQHYAVVRDGAAGTLELFVDGISMGSQSGQSTPINITHFLLGQDQDSAGGNFDANQAHIGNMEDLRIWETARSAAEILANQKTVLAGSETGLRAYYRFNEGSGSILTDETANNYDGNILGPYFDGDVNAAGFNPATIGMRAQYFATVTVIDSVDPLVASTSFPEVSSDGYFTSFTVTFSEDVNPETALLGSNYELRASGEDGLFDTEDDAIYTIEPQPYSSGTQVSYFLPDGPLQPGDYRFKALSAIEDRAGNSLVAYEHTFSLTPLGDFIIENRDNNSVWNATSVGPVVTSQHDGSFSEVYSIAANNIVWAAAVELNNDGRPDFLAISDNGMNIGVYLNNGDGTFTAGNTYSLVDNSYDAVLVDLDGDGDEDIAIASRDDDRVRIFFNNGDGTLATGPVLVVGDGPLGIAAGNIDGTGQPDLVTANENDGTLSILLNTGNGATFDVVSLPLEGTDPQRLVIANFDTDPALDIVYTDNSSQRVVFLPGNGDGTFGDPVFSPVDPEQARPTDIKTGDLDGDGLLDIVVAHGDAWRTDFASILFGTGDGTFGNPVRFSTGSYRTELFLEDINGDGLLDIISGNDTSLRYYLGTGNREAPLQSAVVFNDLDDCYGVAIADFDNDGLTDFVAGEPNNDLLYLYTGNTTQRPLADATAPGFYQALGRGNLRDTDDVDWYRFSAKAGEGIVLVTGNANTGDSQAGLRYELYGPGTNRKLTDASSYTGGYLQTQPYYAQADGTYYLRVSRSYNYFQEYRFRLTIAPKGYQLESENNYRTLDADPVDFAVDAGQRTADLLGQLLPGDTSGDFFALGNLASGTDVNLAFFNTEDSSLDPKLWIYSRSGNTDTIEAEEAQGVTSLGFTATADGTYFARVTTPNENLDFFSEYRLSITLTDSQPPAIVSDTLPVEGSTTDDLLISFNLTFNEDLNAASVNDPASFELRGAGGDGLFNTADDTLIPLGSFNYTAGLSETLTILENPLQAGKYRFTAFSGGVEDLFGNTLPTDYVREFTVAGLDGYLTESTDNDTFSTADPLTTDPPGGFAGSFTLLAASGLESDGPQGFKLLDINSDSIPDAVVTSTNDDRLTVYFGNGDGTFTTGPVYPLGGDVFFTRKLDIDADGDLDLALSERGSTDGLRLFRNNGDGTLTDLGLTPGGTLPSDLSFGDLDGQNGLDIVLSNLGTNNSNGSVSIYLQQPDGSFAHSLFLDGVDLRARDVEVALLDGDNIPDLAVADFVNRTVLVAIGNGDGSFADPVSYPLADFEPGMMTGGDFNGDGHYDLAVAHHNHNEISILPGNGDGTFGEFIPLGMGNYRSGRLDALDLNADGMPDLVATGDLGTGWRYSTPGSFFEGSLYFTDPSGNNDTREADAADVDGDGLTDLVTVAWNTDNILVFLGDPEFDLGQTAGFPELEEVFARGRDVLEENNPDFYRFTATAGQKVLVDVETDISAWASHRFILYDSFGNQLFDSTLYYAYEQFGPVSIPRDGTYYFRAIGNDGHDDTYRFRISLVDASTQPESEANNSYNQADNLVFSEEPGLRKARVFASAPVGEDNSDWFGIGNLAENAQITVTFTQPDDSNLVPQISLRANNGNAIRITGDPGQSQITYTLNAGEEDFHYIVVSCDNRNFRGRYFIDVEIEDLQAPEITSLTLPDDGTTSSTFYVNARLSFSEDLQAEGVIDPASYQLINAGPDNAFGTADDFTYTIAPQGYTSGLFVDLVIEDEPLQPGLHRFRIPADALLDLFGNPLAADFIREFTIEGIVPYVGESNTNEFFEDADTLSVNPNELHDGSFLLAGQWDAGVDPKDLVLVDVTDDGVPDVVVATGYRALDLLVFTNDGSGELTGPESVLTAPYPDEPRQLAVADFNGDGRDDIAMSVVTVNSSASSRIVILQNNGDGTLSEIFSDPNANQPTRMDVGDLDSDGHPDLVVVEEGGSPRVVSIYMNDGTGTAFTRATFSDFDENADLRGIALEDFNGDGSVDAVVTDVTNNRLYVLHGQGDGTFVRTTTIDTAVSSPHLVDTGDLDGDGHPDIAVSYNLSNRIGIFTGNGDFSFDPEIGHLLEREEFQTDILVGDFTDDDLADIAVATRRYDGFTVFTGQRGAGFYLSGPQVYTVPTYATAIASGDLDQDGRSDLIITDLSGDYLGFYPGNSGLPLTVDSSVVGLRTGMGRGTVRNGTNSNDLDYWAFSARAGDRLLVTSENTSGAWLTDIRFGIHGPGGNELVSFSTARYGGVGQSPPLTLDFNGRVTLSLSDSDHQGDEYRINVNLVPAPAQIESENNDNASQANAPVFAISPGEQEALVFGAVDREDSNGDHFFLGNLDGGTSIQVRLDIPENSLLDPRLAIYRDGDPVLAETTTSVPALDATVPTDAPGAYYARIGGTQQTRGFRGTYLATLRLLDTVPPEIISTNLPQDPSSAIFSEVIIQTNEDFDPETVNDPAAFDLRAAGPDLAFGTDDDIIVPIGSINYTGGSTITLPLTDNPLPPGEYRFTAAGFLRDNYGNTLPGDYVQSFSMVALDGFVTESIGNDSPDTATPIPLDDVLPGIHSKGARGRLASSNEMDYWSFSATSGQVLVFDSDWPGSPNFTSLQLLVTAPDGSTVVDQMSNRNGDHASSGQVPLTQSGEYTVRVDRGFDAYTGEYRFRVTLVDSGTDWETEANDSTATANAMTLTPDANGSSGNFFGLISSATDRDYVSLGTIAPGNTLFLSVEPSTNGPLVPVVSVYRVSDLGDDVFISEVPSGRNGDGVVEIDVIEEHEYFALVRGSSATGGLMSEYQLSAQLLPTDLANFANLQVTNVTLPAAGGILSGDPITFSFTVTNVGADPTEVSAWIDRVAISSNNIFGDGDDFQLAVVNREAPLGVNESYTIETTANLPDGISGSFFLIVRTDTADQVDEFLFEGDNELASSGTFNISLSTYPDLVVQDLVIPEPNTSGDVTLTWKTANTGNGDIPADGEFVERVEVVDRVTGGIAYASSDVLSGPLAAGGSVDRSLALTGLLPANYRIRIIPDFADDYFEFNASGHLAAEQNQRSGDFIVYRFFQVETFSSPVDGGSTSGGGTIREGNSVTVEAIPDTSLKPYSFVRWKSAAGALLTTDPVYNFVPTANIDLIAEFQLPIFTIGTERNIDAAGTVSGGGGFRWGSEIAIQARTSPGYLFERFEDAADGSVLGTNSLLPLTVTGDLVVRAVFAEKNPSHDVTVATNPQNIASLSGTGTYGNGDVLALSAPPTVVDLPTEHVFQQWRLNGQSFAGTADASKTFSTLDPPVMDFVAVYSSRSFEPEVTAISSLVSTDRPIPAGRLFGVTLTFDREMDTAIDPVLTLISADAAEVPSLGTGRWISSTRWESGTVSFVSANSGQYTLQISGATGGDGRVLSETDLLAFAVDATPPDNPVIALSATGDGTATIEWNAYSAPADLSSFRIYLKDVPFDSVTPAGSLSSAGSSTRQFTFTNIPLDSGRYAAVVAVDLAGNANETVTTLPIRLDSDLPPAVPFNIVRDAPDSALLDWSGYDTSGLTGFDGFLVFREESDFNNVSTLVPVASLPADASTYRTEVLDRTRTYYFAVVGINRLGDFEESVSTQAWSDPLSGNITEDLVFGGPGQRDIDILGPMTLLNGATLTVLPGTTLYFDPTAGIAVENGVLHAAGTALEPILFTAAIDEANPDASVQDWQGITLADAANSSVLEHLWILHGNGLEVSGADPQAANLGIVDNAGAGLTVSSGASFTGSGLYLALNEIGVETLGSGTSATLTGSVLQNNLDSAATASPDSTIAATGSWWGTDDAATILTRVDGTVDTSGFLDQEPLLGLDLALEAGIPQTTNNRVDLLLGAMNATAYRLSEDSTFAGVPFVELHPEGTTSFILLDSWPVAYKLSEGAGTKTLFAEFLSPTGGLSETRQIEVVLIDEGPEIVGWNLDEGDSVQRPITISASATSPVGIQSVRMEVDGETVLSTEASSLVETWDISAYQSGIYRLRLVAEDLSGNLATRSINVTIDPQPPAAPAISSPVAGSLLTVDSVDISGSAEPGIPLRVTVNGTRVADGEAAPDGGFAFDSLPLLEGENRIIVTAFDAAGSSASPALSIISDTTSPLAPVMEEPLYDPESGLLVQWRFPDTEGERPSRYKVYWDTEPITDLGNVLGASDILVSQSFAFEDQPNQDYFFRVVGFDAANNASAPSNEVTAFFDDTPPVIEIFYDKPVPVGAGELLITLVSNEPLQATPSLTIKPEGRRLPIAVPLDETAPSTWEAAFIVSDASMRSGLAEVLVTARDEDSNLLSGAPVGPDLVVDLTRPTGVLRTNIESPLQILTPKQIELTLELTEPAKAGTVPSLKWSPPTGPEVVIDLEGSEDIWTGTLTLFPEMGKGDGIFLLEVLDSVENKGTLLTSGGTYEIYNTTLPDPPGQPPQLLAQTLPGGEVRLAWQEAYRAETYNVYRVPSAQGGTPNVLVREGIMEQEYIDLPPADGQYRYVVTASRFGAEGNPSPAFTVTSDRTPPPPPENIAVDLGVNGVVVSFDPPSGGETPYGYVLYRNGSATNRTARLPGELRDFPPRGVMEYQVAASDVYGNHSLTEVASIEMFLGPVKDVEVLVEPGEPVRLVWDKTDPITEGYNLYRNGVRQNGTILSNPFYSDPLSLGGQSVTYAITAVNELGQESAARQIIVQPVRLDFLLNPDEDGEEFDSIAGYFDRYRVSISQLNGSPVEFDKVDYSRELSNGSYLARSLDFDVSVAAQEEISREVVVPAPVQEVFEQAVTMTAQTVPGPGGGIVLYRYSRSLPPAIRGAGSISLAAKVPPLAGGLTDFSVTLTNRGRTEADFVLFRDSGDEAGDFSISVYNEDGLEVAVTPFQDFVSGMQVNSRGDGFLRLQPGESRTFTVPDVFVPITLADADSARFVGRLDNIYYKVGSNSEDVNEALLGTMSSTLVETDYYGTSSTSRGIYSNDDVITITGESLDRDTGQPVGEKALRIGFEIQGFVFHEEVQTDADGNYAFDYKPSPGIGGEVSIWAAHPDVVDQLDQTTIVIYRSFLSPARGNIKMSKNDFIDFQITLINVGDRQLTDFSVESRAYTVDEEGNETEVDSLVAELRESIISPVSARQRVPVKLRLTSTLDAPDNLIVEIAITSAEGARSVFTGAVSLLPAIPVLDVVSPRVGYVDLTVNKGDIVSRQVTITNSGLRPLEDVVITPPQNLAWMQLNLPRNGNGEITLPDLAVGDTTTFSVVYTPPEGTEIGFYDDFVLISGSNAVADFRLNLFAQVSSSQTGSVEFFVDNNLVLPIPNASVRLRNVALGIEAGPAFTDANGYVRFDDLQEGKWSWTASAPGHQARAGTIDVIADQSNGVDVRLGKSLVTVNFSVVPVPFTDRYEIKIEQTFETRVPAPVLVMDPPKYDFETEDAFEIDVVYTLTNHGLISVFDLNITASRGKRLRIIPLIDYLPELKAQETVEIPAKIIFSGFDSTLADSSLLSSGAASLQLLGGDLTDACSDDSNNLAGQFLEGLQEIAKMNASADYNCVDGDLGGALAGALAFASGYKAAALILKNSTPAELIVSAVGNFLGGCLSFSSSPGSGGGGGGPGHTSGGSFNGIGRGCFVAGTQVLMADGSHKSIETIRKGDRVVTSSDGSVARVSSAFTLSVPNTVTIRLADGRQLTTTPSHRIWIDGHGWELAGNLGNGAFVSMSDGNFAKVSTLGRSSTPERVYTFQLEGDSAFYANGMLVEDLCGGRALDISQLENLQPLSGSEEESR